MTDWLTPPASWFRLNMFCPPASPVVAPDTINNHVKTCYEEQKNLHFYAPEYGGRLVFMQSVCLCCYLTSGCIRLWRFSPFFWVVFFSTYYVICTFSSFFLILDDDVTTAVDIYSFGMCALEVRLFWLTIPRLHLLYNSMYEQVCWCV